MLDHDALTAFITFADHLNLTHAARALHLSQPALHARLQRLSEQVGAPLYTRQGRRLLLTEAGAQVLAFARDTQGAADRLLDRIHGRDPTLPVVLASGEGALLYLLPQALAAFAQERPAPLRLLTADADAALRALRDGSAHLAVTSLRDGAAPDLARTHLASAGQHLVLPCDHPLAARDVIALDDLRDQPLIVPPLGRPHREHIARALRDADVPWHVAVEASGWETMLRFAALGVGLALVNDLCPPPPGCVARPVPALGRRDYHLLHRREHPPTGPAARLAALIQRPGRALGPGVTDPGPAKATP